MNLSAFPRTAATALAMSFTLLLSACAGTPVRDVTAADAPRALPETSGVSVSWSDPANFSDLRRSSNRWESKRGDWVNDLASHLQQSVTRALPAGERAAITITDIRRAGDYEPWNGPQMNDVRIMRDIYWPQITLQLRRTDATGRELEGGERVLRDPAYLTSGVRSPRGNEALYYEKRMVDDWVRREFGAR
ncbi:DUF3016 domain-containing protein [Luteimonas yindakuii]|uniref:DUF3016 domain-containing protein n=1 Tax=Luteimonas yindakuii TaxID=2565782 RepID=UPI001FC97082|nr:DUF3016 domain-containing protein [Luteimonas yindakuii]